MKAYSKHTESAAGYEMECGGEAGQVLSFAKMTLLTQSLDGPSLVSVRIE
jgi:hypothetical protein